MFDPWRKAVTPTQQSCPHRPVWGLREGRLLPQGHTCWPKPTTQSSLLPFASDGFKGEHVTQFWRISHKEKFAGRILGKILLPDEERAMC